MVVAGEKHLEHYAWGDKETFHALEDNGRKYRLFDEVTIATNDGKIKNGQIVAIFEQSVHIVPEGRPVSIINLEDIKKIAPS